MERQIANEFINVIHQWLMPEQIDEIVLRNRHEPSGKICHTHDFCDANVAMLEAFTWVTGRDADFEDDDEKDIKLINRAWDIAKAKEFKKGGAK